MNVKPTRKKATMYISPHFDNFIFDWNYETYLLIGSYGSGKSYAAAEKILLKLFQEKRKCVIFRNVYRTIKESVFDLIKEILSNMFLLAPEGTLRSNEKVVMKLSPLSFTFPNGSRIVFMGMDSTEKIKSLNGASILWVEECSEISQAAYLELLGRVRMPPGVSMHFILTCNPVSRANWIYKTFFERLGDDGRPVIVCDERHFYEKRVFVKNGVYYNHSQCEDNPYIDLSYILRLDKIKYIDRALWKVARLGQFGTTGLRVLPRFEVMPHEVVIHLVSQIPSEWHRVGMDFGYETSYNAVTRSAVDKEKKILYIYKEFYRNKMTDDETAVALEEWDAGIKNCTISADCAEPKAIRYYNKMGFHMRPCKKRAESKSEGSRIANAKKFKRFFRVVCSDQCKNCINELQDLTYKKDKNGDICPGQFNIDAHTFSSLWYAWDDYDVTNYKRRTNNSWKGGD